MKLFGMITSCVLVLGLFLVLSACGNDCAQPVEYNNTSCSNYVGRQNNGYPYGQNYGQPYSQPYGQPYYGPGQTGGYPYSCQPGVPCYR